MKPATRALSGVLVVLAVSACPSSPSRGDRADPARADAASADAAPPQTTLPSTPAPAAAPAPGLRVVAHSGEVSGIDAEDAPARDRLLTLAPGASLALAVGHYARLWVRGPAVLMLAPDGAPALLLRTGVLTVDSEAPVLPDAAPALWVATGTVQLEVAQRARFVLRARSDGSLLSLVSGVVRASHEGTKRDLAEDTTRCYQRSRVSSYPPLLGKLEARSEEMASAPPCARVEKRSDAPLAQPLREELAALTEEKAHGRELLASHRALSQADAGAAARTQTELARHAARLMVMSEEVRTRRRVLAARTLGDATPALRALLARARDAAP